MNLIRDREKAQSVVTIFPFFSALDVSSDVPKVSCLHSLLSSQIGDLILTKGP